MDREIILIKCDKCGGTNVVDEKIEKITEVTLSMDEYIEKNKSFSMFSGIMGTSYGETRALRCKDCGFEREYFRVVYT